MVREARLWSRIRRDVICGFGCGALAAPAARSACTDVVIAARTALGLADCERADSSIKSPVGGPHRHRWSRSIFLCLGQPGRYAVQHGFRSLSLFDRSGTDHSLDTAHHLMLTQRGAPTF